MLLQHELCDAVEIFAVSGPVRASDAETLRVALERALALHPRGVLVDLTAAGPLAPEAVAVLREVRQQAPGWPRPALVVCGGDAELAGLDAPVRAGRRDAMEHIDDRSPAPRRRFGLDHALRTPALARHALAQAVDDLHLEPLSDDLKLVVTELVTNAIRYAEPPVELEIEADEDSVTVAVLDGTPGRPLVRRPPEDAEGGRGLLLIDLIAAESGVRPQRDGKTIWATLERHL
ncbi:MAG: ATP-binding protein [Actinobacteria bacterium]|nr:ATP-binding protein [Actinomycetota bacterium]MCA1719606.1 ATP-binding protein [Actinomycetota bacterium]